jgi:hypothetical protein
MRDPNPLSANEAFGFGKARGPGRLAATVALLEVDASAGVRLAKDGQKVSSASRHVKPSGNRVSWTDGPFTESKELLP